MIDFESGHHYLEEPAYGGFFAFQGCGRDDRYRVPGVDIACVKSLPAHKKINFYIDTKSKTH